MNKIMSLFLKLCFLNIKIYPVLRSLNIFLTQPLFKYIVFFTITEQISIYKCFICMYMSTTTCRDKLKSIFSSFLQTFSEIIFKQDVTL